MHAGHRAQAPTQAQAHLVIKPHPLNPWSCTSNRRRPSSTVTFTTRTFTTRISDNSILSSAAGSRQLPTYLAREVRPAAVRVHLPPIT